MRELKGLCKLVCCLTGPFGIWTILVGRDIRVVRCICPTQASVAKSATPKRLYDGYAGAGSIYSAQHQGINDHYNGL